MLPADPFSTARFGWSARLRNLLLDLVVFDRQRLGWRLAIRTTVALVGPLELARLLAMPLLTWVGIGAFLLAVGDSTDDGDRHQILRLVVGAGLGGLALASGVLAATTLFTAVLGMLFWGAVAGLIGVYGNAFATMGLPIAWAYVELGLPAHDHSPASAATFGVLFALGGGLTMTCTWLASVADPYRPLQHATAAAFRALATYLRIASAQQDDDPREPVSPETGVRTAIAEARRSGAELRRGQQAWSGVAQRNLLLIEIADRLFSFAAVLRERPKPAMEPNPSLAALGDAISRLAAAIAAPSSRAKRRDLLVGLNRIAPQSSAACVEGQMAAWVERAVEIVFGNAPVERVSPILYSTSRTPSGFPRLLFPLIVCFDRNSVVGRHALRFGLVCAAGVIAFRFFPPPFGYWIPLTVTVVLKPYAGATLSRTVQRVVGTGAGILASSVLMSFVAAPQFDIIAVAVAFFWMMAVLPFNYCFAIFFLSAGLIPLEHLLYFGLPADVALLRLAATGVGAFLALVGGHLLWPDFEYKNLPSLLHASIGSMTIYADQVLGQADEASFEAAHRAAGLDTTNLQAAIQRASGEIDIDAEAFAAFGLAAAALQRLFVSLNAVRNALPAPAAADMMHFRPVLVSALNCVANGDDVAPLSAAAAGSGFLGYEFNRIAGQVVLLQIALRRLKGASPGLALD
jgi:uncharacterized membrane protein YccC